MRPRKQSGLQLPPTEKLMGWLQGAGVIVLVAVVAFVIQGLTSPIHHLSTYNKDQMREVFSSNDTWVVACHNTSEPVVESFAFAASELSREMPSVKFGILDCGGTLPSGKTVWKRFNLEDREQSVFVVGPGLKPVQAPKHHMDSSERFGKWLKSTVEPHAVPVATTREFEAKCLQKPRCAVVLKAGALSEAEKAAFKGAMVAHRAMRFVTIDALKHELSVERKIGLSVGEGQHHLLYFERAEATATDGADAAKAKPKKGEPRWGLSVYSGAIATAEMADWLREMQSPEGVLRPVTRLPTVMTRKPPKKATAPPEQSESAAGGAGSGGGGGSASGPGNNPEGGGYSGLTREEILEKFRRQQQQHEEERRAKMEQEADEFILDAEQQDQDRGSAGLDEADGWEEDDVVDLDAL